MVIEPVSGIDHHVAFAQRWPGAAHTSALRNGTIGTGHRRGGVVGPDNLAAITVVDADNPIKVTRNDRPIGGRNCGRYPGVAEGAALAADFPVRGSITLRRSQR